MSLTALVTGANKGIGYEIVKQLLATNKFNKIFLCARDEKRGKEAVSKIPNNSNNIVEFLPLDVSSASSVAKAAEIVKGKQIPLHVVINNAGVLYHEVSHQIAQETMNVNYYGVKRVTDAFLPLLEKEKYARIVNVSSDLGRLANDEKSKSQLSTAALEKKSIKDLDKLVDEYVAFHATNKNAESIGWSASYAPTYSISKRFLNAYTRLLARDLKAQGSSVTVNSMTPGWCQTDMGGEEAPLPASEGAKTAVFLATSESVANKSGLYFDRCKESNF